MVRCVHVVVAFICQMFLVTAVYAGVTMAGTRVIFPAESKDRTLQFSNKDDLPFLVQIWLDSGNEQSTPENADAPFMVNPQVFRINGNRGQTARLFYTGGGQLPKDRESIFYLNFKQIPTISKDSMDQNKLVLIVNSRLKVFYRPKKIVGKVEDLPKKLTYSLQKDAEGTWVQINNPTGYYANLTQAALWIGADEIEAKDVKMIEPKSSAKWLLEKNIAIKSQTTLKITLVNDYGAYTSHDITVQP